MKSFVAKYSILDGPPDEIMKTNMASPFIYDVYLLLSLSWINYDMYLYVMDKCQNICIKTMIIYEGLEETETKLTLVDTQ